MLNKIKAFKFQGLAMELTLVVVNVLLVLGLITFWNSYFKNQTAENEAAKVENMVTVDKNSHGSK